MIQTYKPASIVIHPLCGCQSHLVKLKKFPNPQRRKTTRERLLMQLATVPTAQEQNKCCRLLVKMVSSGIDSQEDSPDFSRCKSKELIFLMTKMSNNQGNLKPPRSSIIIFLNSYELVHVVKGFKSEVISDQLPTSRKSTNCKSTCPGVCVCVSGRGNNSHIHVKVMGMHPGSTRDQVKIKYCTHKEFACMMESE